MAEMIIFRQFEGAEIWHHFERSKCGKLSECKSSRRISRGLHVHLKTIHLIEILKRTTSVSNSVHISRPNVAGKLDRFINDAIIPALL